MRTAPLVLYFGVFFLFPLFFSVPNDLHPFHRFRGFIHRARVEKFSSDASSWFLVFFFHLSSVWFSGYLWLISRQARPFRSSTPTYSWHFFFFGSSGKFLRFFNPLFLEFFISIVGGSDHFHFSNKIALFSIELLYLRLSFRIFRFYDFA